MFSTITWETFLTTVVLLAGGYYTITALLLYHKEIIQRFKSRSTQELSAPPQTTNKEDSSGIIGNVREEKATTRSSSVSAEEVNVGAADEEEPETIKVLNAISEDTDRLLIGSVADLLQEVRTVFQLVADYKSDKTECESLLRTLLLRYPHVRNTAYRKTITEYICEAGTKQFSFTVRFEEVYRWWEEALKKDHST